MIDKEKNLAFLWAVSTACLFVIVVTLMIVRANDRQITVEITNVEQANTDIEGYYDMYSKALTQHSRDLTITRIKKQFKGYDAANITNKKYRNFLINTRNN